ncbi:MAG: PepSY domain-containing protein [Verrucomicrobiae bacterium]|nr:PepSY domain-containing protein [Verrucomicrobiae bacterium]
MAIPYLIYQVTAAYSNAVLVAVMPYISNFAEKLDLPVSQPVTVSQVDSFRCSPRSDEVGGRVLLTNGCSFVFHNGGIRAYASPESYYSIDDPSLIPKFFGEVKLTKEEAVAKARNALKKLGYSEAMVFSGSAPQVINPPEVRKHHVARYQIRWFDPTWGAGGPSNLPSSVEFEIDATTGRIEAATIFNPNTWGPDPNISVHPMVIEESPKPIYLGGRNVYPVSGAYSNAFLIAILPQCADYAKTVGFSPEHGIVFSEVDKAKCVCGLVDGDPMAEINFNDGARFVYRHGQVIAFYAPNVMSLPGKEPSSRQEYQEYWKRFYGRINMTTNQAVVLVRQTIERLGYSQKLIHVDEMPIVGGTMWWGTNRVARCSILWRGSEDGPTRVQAEVDMTAKAIKSLYINDHAITNIWREPPRIGVSMKG